jgi:hypothetical protein
LVRTSDELPKPNASRLREYVDSQLPAVKQQLFSAAPIYDELEIATLTFSLTKLREELGADDPFVRKVLGKDSPRDLARALVTGTKLKSVQQRKALFEGGKAAVEASQDPLVQFARLIDPEARIVRSKYEDELEPVFKMNREKIAKAQFEIYGTQIYPDATFTLRLSYGDVRGYEDKGKTVKPLTSLAGAFERHTGKDPFALPRSWLSARSKLNPETPFNFVTTNDIIGGNSGSPVVNKNAEVVGLIFDGNIQSLGGDYGFDPKVNRAVAVHSAAILEALDKIYGAQRITRELRPAVSPAVSNGK